MTLEIPNTTDTITNARKANRLYFLEVKGLEQNCNMLNNTMVALIDYEHPVWRWHGRAGHIRLHNMRKFPK